ncbi:hypothetical protein JL101_030760 (plasmid) [Skermanella rosea]|uniref:hypothetical protein n=1 Tax=Skermanella rosea TaxID=1817965 RepID=UPI0019318147|nr:hypothetical protein [Skermanella rosea]UEM06871.1 hypothetical protein JL101_030760 [Skermanella rosea]
MHHDDDDLPNASAAPLGATGQAAEYLERLVTEGFRRELDQEENVVRSLPFFATSVGILITFIGFAHGTLAPFALAFWPLLEHGLLAGLIGSLALLLWFLFQAVRLRTFSYAMGEVELIRHAADLTAYYRQAEDQDAGGGPAGSEADPTALVEQAVIDDLRGILTRQFAEAAVVSRANNAKRLRARARAFSVLMVAMSFALALIIAISVKDALDGGAYGPHGELGTSPEAARAPGVGERQAPQETGTSPDAPGREGSLDLPGDPGPRDSGRPAAGPGENPLTAPLPEVPEPARE